MDPSQPPLELPEAAQSLPIFVVPALAIIAGAVAGLLLASLIRAGIRMSARQWPALKSTAVRVKWPQRVLLASLGVWLAIQATTQPSTWTRVASQAMVILAILAFGWLLVQITHVVADGVKARFPTDSPDNRHARRIHTQVQVVGRLVVAIIVVVATAAALFTFPEMRALGASILASAGLAAIIAGVAAQSSLANLFAGMQVAFADAIRVDDVVVVEGEWGVIEEITLTYVVVHIWDDRRLVLPSTYFTTQPFQNWTRESSQLLGTVELEVDWTVPMEGLRREMNRLLSQTDLWDQRVGVIQVTEATGGMITVRALASARSAPVLWDLRCHLREGLVTWLQQNAAGLPRARFEPLPMAGAPTRAGAPPAVEAPSVGAEPPGEPRGVDSAVPMSVHDTGLFTGTYEAVRRSERFSGPAKEVMEERTRAVGRSQGAGGSGPPDSTEGFPGWD